VKREWLTVSSPEGAEDVELVLEPNNSPPARSSQKAQYHAGFPAAVFTKNNLVAAYHTGSNGANRVC